MVSSFSPNLVSALESKSDNDEQKHEEERGELFWCFIKVIYIPLFSWLVGCVLGIGLLFLKWVPWMNFGITHVFGCLVDARKMFEKMPHSYGGSWNVVILLYVQGRRARKDLSFFFYMNN